MARNEAVKPTLTTDSLGVERVSSLAISIPWGGTRPNCSQSATLKGRQ
jgi:hypothetical protein